MALKSGAVRGLFEVELDTNADKRFNFYVDVFYASGHFRGVLFKPSGDVITYSLKDVIPNRFPLIRHDFTPPTAKWGPFPYYSSDVSATLSVPLSFTVHDDPFGSGVKQWSLQRKALGTVG